MVWESRYVVDVEQSLRHQVKDDMYIAKNIESAGQRLGLETNVLLGSVGERLVPLLRVLFVALPSWRNALMLKHALLSVNDKKPIGVQGSLNIGNEVNVRFVVRKLPGVQHVVSNVLSQSGRLKSVAQTTTLGRVDELKTNMGTFISSLHLKPVKDTATALSIFLSGKRHMASHCRKAGLFITLTTSRMIIALKTFWLCQEQRIISDMVSSAFWNLKLRTASSGAS